MKLKGRKIYKGTASGSALVTSMAISLYGGVDPDTGVVVEKGHELEGIAITDRILVFPTGKGSTVGSYTLYRLKMAGRAPIAIINTECETITAVGCIISEIPCIDQIAIEKITTGNWVDVDADNATVVIS